MFDKHPLTHLDCYERPVGQGPRQISLPAATVLLAVAASLLPADLIFGDQRARVIEGGELAICLLSAALWQLLRRRNGHSAMPLPVIAAALWIGAPLAGVAGILLLRLPILQIALIGQVHRIRLNREARQFPATISRP